MLLNIEGIGTGYGFESGTGLTSIFIGTGLIFYVLSFKIVGGGLTIFSFGWFSFFELFYSITGGINLEFELFYVKFIVATLFV